VWDEVGLTARSAAITAALPRKKANGDASIRPFRIGTSSDSRPRACSLRIATAPCLIVGHLDHDAAEGHGRGHGHRPGGDGPPASASATAATITARLDLAEWEVVTAQESHRTMSGPGGHETTIHDVVPALPESRSPTATPIRSWRLLSLFS
jgi:hypothetical protein